MMFVRFGLIVTGRGEHKFLPKLFRSLMAAANCTFEVIRKSEQLSPVTSAKRQLKMVGRGQVIPTIDEEQFGWPARSFLLSHQNSFVIVIDDLEGARGGQVNAVFVRYRQALDQFLTPLNLSGRASVHFLVNMLEAYYFAHAQAVNTSAGRIILQEDHPTDVEAIAHPKNTLKYLWIEFDEVEHGDIVIGKLDLQHVLQTPGHCCWLRSLFAWCINRLPAESIWDNQIHQWFQLPVGCRASLTDNQGADTEKFG